MPLILKLFLPQVKPFIIGHRAAHIMMITALLFTGAHFAGCSKLQPQPQPGKAGEAKPAGYAVSADAAEASNSSGEWGRLISSKGQTIEFECMVSGASLDNAVYFFIIPPEGEAALELQEARPADDREELSISLVNLEKLVEFQTKGFARGWRLGSLTINKRQRGAMIKSPTILRMAITFDTPYTAPPALADAARAALAMPRGFSAILNTLVENPADAVRFAAAHPAPADAAPPAKWLFTENSAASEFWLKIAIDEPGVYAIGPQTLLAAGLRPASYDLAHFRLFNQGREIPLVELAGRGVKLDGPNRLFFAGEAPSSPYTADNIYWLGYQPGQPAHRAAPLDTPPPGAEVLPLASVEEHARREQELELMVKRGSFLSIEEVRWVGPTMASDAPTTQTFDLPGYDPALQNRIKMEIRVYMNGPGIPPERTVNLDINSTYTTSFELLSPARDSITLEIPSVSLRERGNHLVFSLQDKPDDKPLRPGALYLDHIDVTYQRRLTADDGQLHLNIPGVLSDAASTSPTLAAPSSDHAAKWWLIEPEGFTNFPVMIMNAPDPANPQARIALTPSALPLTIAANTEARLHIMSMAEVEPVAGAVHPVADWLARDLPDCDYLIISHRDFIEGIQPLAAWHRERNGLKTAIVDVQSIYNEFNFGLESPLAIKNFLMRLALDRGLAAPTYVLLVGDCSSDYKNYARNDVRNFVPTFTYQTGAHRNEMWASDYWYSTVLGDDALGEYVISRISVNNTGDLANIVAKTLQYMQAPVFDPWRIHLASVADDGEFDEESEVLRKKKTPGQYLTNTIYLEDLPWVDNYFLPADVVEEKKAKVSTAGTAEIITAFNTGTLYMTYYGHGSPNIWSDERLWFGGDSENSDNLHLTNFDRPTFVANLTCNSGAIDYPIPRWNITITEDMMRMERGGAIGVFAPSGPGHSSAHQALASALSQGMFYRGVRGIGDAVMRARLQYALSERSPDLVQMFVQLGDPAVDLQTPQGRAAFKPSTVELSSSEARELTFTAEPGFAQGRAWFYLTDEKGRIVGNWPDQPFSGGATSVVIMLPGNTSDSEWRVSGYFTDESGTRDSAGGAIIRRHIPWATVEEFRQNPVRTPGAADFIATIENQSPLDISSVRAALERLDDSGTWVEIDSWKFALAGMEKREMKVNAGPLDPGLTILRFRLLDHAEPPLPTLEPKPEKRAVYVTPLGGYDPADHASLLLFPEPLLEIEARQSSSGVITYAVNSTITNLNPDYNARAIVRLVSRQVKVAETAPVTVPSSGVSPIQMMLSVRPDRPLGHVQAVVEGEWVRSAVPGLLDGPATIPLRLQMPWQRALPPLQDIAIEQVALSPESPTEGETVFIDVRVSNRGGSPARDVMIKAFDTPPGDGGRELKSMTAQARPIRIAYLAPGGETKVRLRWDPFRNLAIKQIHIVADPNNTSPDADRANNMVAAPVRVRTKAILQGRGIFLLPPTDEERRLGRIRVEAYVENVGETEAVGIIVAMFKTPEHLPADQIAEIMIPRIEPGEVQKATATWQLTREDLTAGHNLSFQLYYKGSLQRMAGMAAMDAPPQ